MGVRLKGGDLVRAKELDGRRWTDEVGCVRELGKPDPYSTKPSRYVEVCWSNGETTWEEREDLERVALTKLPRELTRTAEWHDDKAKALKLWDDGFRPVNAIDLKRGMVVAYVATFFDQPIGDVRFATVNKVVNAQDEGLVTVEHGGGSTEADEYEQVWAKEVV